MRTPIAERVLAGARLMLIRHGQQFPVDRYALEWAQFIVAANGFTAPLPKHAPKHAPKVPGLKIHENAIATRHAILLAWMP